MTIHQFNDRFTKERQAMADQRQMTREQRAFMEQMAAARKQFQAALSAGQVHVFDRFQTDLKVGSRIIYKTAFDLIFDVVDVSPVFDIAAPIGTMRVTLRVNEFPITVQANVINPMMIVLGEAAADAATSTQSTTNESASAGATGVQDDGASGDRADTAHADTAEGDGAGTAAADHARDDLDDKG